MRISSVLVLIQFSVPSCSQWFKYAEHWHIISAIGILQSKTISLQKTLRKTFFFFIRRPPETLLKTYKNTQLGIMLCVWYGFSTKRLNYLLEILKITFPDEKKTLLHKYANIFSFEVFFGGPHTRRLHPPGFCVCTSHVCNMRVGPQVASQKVCDARLKLKFKRLPSLILLTSNCTFITNVHVM